MDLPGEAGRLEAVVEVPQAEAAPAAFLVVCHPHPLHGGTMDNKVVTTLARTAHQAGAASIRFNFRGVGASEGSFDEGRGETQDALAAVAYGRQRWPACRAVAGGLFVRWLRRIAREHHARRGQGGPVADRGAGAGPQLRLRARDLGAQLSVAGHPGRGRRSG